MKRCEYCGRENVDELVQCRECGTRLGPPVVPGQEGLVELELPGSVTLGLKLTALFILLLSLYFLSFGPVARYCSTRRTTAISGVVLGVRTTVGYPAWVRVLYAPALALAGRRNGVYAEYIDWWQRR